MPIYTTTFVRTSTCVSTPMHTTKVDTHKWHHNGSPCCPPPHLPHLPQIQQSSPLLLLHKSQWWLVLLNSALAPPMLPASASTTCVTTKSRSIILGTTCKCVQWAIHIFHCRHAVTPVQQGHRVCPCKPADGRRVAEAGSACMTWQGCAMRRWLVSLPWASTAQTAPRLWLQQKSRTMCREWGRWTGQCLAPACALSAKSQKPMKRETKVMASSKQGKSSTGGGCWFTRKRQIAVMINDAARGWERVATREWWCTIPKATQPLYQHQTTSTALQLAVDHTFYSVLCHFVLTIWPPGVTIMYVWKCALNPLSRHHIPPTSLLGQGQRRHS